MKKTKRKHSLVHRVGKVRFQETQSGTIEKTKKKRETGIFF